MLLRKAYPTDLAAVCGLYQTVCADKAKNGLRPWGWEQCPDPAVVEADIAAGRLYCADGPDGMDGMGIAVTVDAEPCEAESICNWLFGVHPGRMQRLAIHPQLQRPDLPLTVMADVEELLRDAGCDSLRCILCGDAEEARSFCSASQLRAAGEAQISGCRETLTGYEKRLTDDCPLLPIRMEPAFRSGKLTPWGGEKLRTVFGKQIPEVPAGESLEVSCIPGFESHSLAGESLPQLIDSYGAGLVGAYAHLPFPLLLKLIDARDKLSVQVHPDDEYAAAKENGKQGKTEAWLILDAAPGSQLVYGLQAGVSPEALKEACGEGAAVEKLLRFVDVKPGDVCFIPAGCVHAIGAGIVLYEIQESSDITYRFYDWDRRDAQGRGRQLHLEQALAVTDVKCQLSPIPCTKQTVSRVLDKAEFSLDLIQPDGEAAVPEVWQFGLLTALDEGLTLRWEGGSMSLSKGETLLLPCSCPRLIAAGYGRLALSMPGRRNAKF